MPAITRQGIKNGKGHLLTTDSTQVKTRTAESNKKEQGPEHQHHQRQRQPNMGEDNGPQVVEKIVRVFTGERKENSDPGGWFSKYIHDAKAAGWEDETILAQFGTHLDDKAWTWYQELPDANKVNMQTIHSTFMKRFAPTEQSRHLNVQEFNNAKLQPGESIEEFVDKLRRLARLLGKNEQDVMDRVQSGLPDHIQSVTIVQQPEDLQQLITIARLAMSTNRTGHSVSFAEPDPKDRIDAAVDRMLEGMNRLSVQTNEQINVLQRSVSDVTSRLDRLEDRSRSRDASRDRGYSRDRSNSGNRGAYRSREFNRNSGQYTQRSQSRELCHRCKRGTHPAFKCKFINATCNKCQGRGHIAEACWGKTKAKYTGGTSR